MAAAEYMTGYQAYDTEDDESPGQFLVNDDEAPVHVLSNGNSNSARWNHIKNLDDFFQRVYLYHQRHGFLCMVIEDVLQLGQFLFIIIFTGFLADCVNYDVLFAPHQRNHTKIKQTFQDIVITPCSCGFHMPAIAACMIIALSFLCLRTIKVLYNTFQYWEIKQFYRIALRIESNELENKTWAEVQDRLMAAQRELLMCIHKNELTQLDIYNRILRYKNYFVAMVNKSVLPLKFPLPFLGEIAYLSHGLKFNMEMILFWGPCKISPFENDWLVRQEYKSVHRRIELSQRLSRNILIIGVANIVLSPLIFLWQILYMFFVYGESIKRQPGFLGSRRWSLYARSYLRHFNELDHELNARLNRAYAASNEYMSGFSSNLLSIIARFVTFVAGSVLIVVICLSIYDEDTLQIEHMLTLITGLGVIITISRVFIPPENYVFCPETLMAKILSEIHYKPDSWRDKAHTSHVQAEFSQLFQFIAVFLIHELLSPLITPIILIFYLRPKSLEIVDFFRNFTIDVPGVGDVCSFAQMDIGKHGCQKWSPSALTNQNEDMRAENGKTELSLMHFTLTNPSWRPPPYSHAYLAAIREKAVSDAEETTLRAENPLSCSLLPLAQPFSSLPQVHNASLIGSTMMRSHAYNKQLVGSLSQHEGPVTQQPVSGGIVEALSQSTSLSGLASGIVTNSEFISNEISVSVMYMHELRKRNELPNIGYENVDSVRQILTDSGSQGNNSINSGFESSPSQSWTDVRT